HQSLSSRTSLIVLSFQYSDAHRDLHSFPTRRSSDLLVHPGRPSVNHHEQRIFFLRIKIAWRVENALDFRSVRRRPRNHLAMGELDRKSTRLNSSHQIISYAVFCLKKKTYHNSTL